MTYTPEGKPLIVMGIHTDINEGMLLRNQLRASQERYLGIVESQKDMIVRVGHT
jgi:hypothetical protein